MSRYYQDAFEELKTIVDNARKNTAVNHLMRELEGRIEAIDLADEHGHWSELVPLGSGRGISAEDWACEVGLGETRLGYWDWASNQLELDREES